MAGFDDLEDAVDDTTSSSTPESTSSTSETPAATEPEDDEAVDPWSTPAFAFDGPVKQTPIYPRRETLEEFDRVRRFEIERLLVEAGVEDEVPKREIHDAVLRVAMESPERVAEAVLEARGIEDGLD